MNYGEIIDYIDGTYDVRFNDAKKWAENNNATFDEIVESRKVIDGKLHRFFRINKFPVPSVPELTFEEKKAIKKSEINRARDEAEQSGFEYMGKVFDSDPISCQRISCAAQAISLLPASDENKITWTCQDNTTIDLTAQELLGLVGALAQWSNECHKKATYLKAQVDEAKTAEELEKIKWSEDA